MELIKIFFHMNVLDFVCISIVALVILVILFYLFCQNITNYIVNNRKRKARKLLSDELGKLNDDLEYYKEKWLGKQDIILSQTIFTQLVQFLQSPNECANNLSLIEKNKRKNLGDFEFQVVSFSPGDNIKIKIIPLNVVISIVHRKDSIKAYMCGINYDVTTYCWDFSASGIRVIGDNEFKQMMYFLVSSNEVAKETGLLDYNKK